MQDKSSGPAKDSTILGMVHTLEVQSPKHVGWAGSHQDTHCISHGANCKAARIIDTYLEALLPS